MHQNRTLLILQFFHGSNKHAAYFMKIRNTENETKVEWRKSYKQTSQTNGFKNENLTKKINYICQQHQPLNSLK
jgi:hypothetical protein